MDPREKQENDRLNAELVMGYVMDKPRQGGKSYRQLSGDKPEVLRDELQRRLAPVGWANQQQRAEARRDYALEGKSPVEIQERWDKSRLLVDPHTQKSQERLLRDYRLLEGLLRKDDPGKVVDQYMAPLDTRLAPEMINRNAQRDLTPEEARTAGDSLILDPKAMFSAGRALLQNLQDPESNAGWYMGRSNLLPQMGKYAGGGEAKDFSDAIGMAAGDLGFKEMHRMGARVPVADLPSDATPGQIRARVGELAGQAALIDAPQYKERYLRTAGYDPGPVVGFLSDLGYDFLDPSLLVDVAAGPVKAALSPAARAYMASKGGLLKNLLKMGGDEAIAEAATEVPLAAGIAAVMPAGGQAYGDHEVKTPEELAQAKELRRQHENKHLGWQNPSYSIYEKEVLPAMQRLQAERAPYGTDAFGRPIVPTPGPFATLPQGVASNR